MNRDLLFTSLLTALFAGTLLGLPTDEALSRREMASITGGDVFGDCLLTGKTCADSEFTGAFCTQEGQTCYRCFRPWVQESNCVGWIGGCSDSLGGGCGQRYVGHCEQQPSGLFNCIVAPLYNIDDEPCEQIRTCNDPQTP